jgi:Uncharacterized protein conserved in bacteria (DUF2313).
MAADLIKYIPPILKEVQEFKVWTDCENPEIDRINAALAEVKDNQYIQTLTEKGAARWEPPLKIVPKDTDTIELRRLRLFAKMNEKLPFTFKSVKNQIEILCGADGYTFELLGNEYRLRVRVALIAKGQLEEVSSTLAKTIPANMVIDLSLLYNQWITLSTKRWSELSTKTWYQARNEVI